MNYNIYILDGDSKTKHVAGFTNAKDANQWASTIQKSTYQRLFIFIIEGEINNTLIPLIKAGKET